LTKTDKKIIIGGDFNIDLDKRNPMKDQLEEWALTSGLTQLVKMPTRYRLVNTESGLTSESSLLDHLYANDETSVTVTQEGSISDHDIIKAEVKLSLNLKKRKKLTIRDWRFYDKEEFQRNLKNSINEVSNYIELTN